MDVSSGAAAGAAAAAAAGGAAAGAAGAHPPGVAGHGMMWKHTMSGGQWHWEPRLGSWLTWVITYLGNPCDGRGFEC